MTETNERDPITHRLVAALDALPLPDEPTGLRGPASPSLARDPRILLAAALVLVLVATVTSPQFQRAAAELSRYIDRFVSGPAWVGYYIEGTGQWGRGDQPRRLRVASSDSQGGPATPDIAGGWANHGAWSPDGKRITVSNDDHLYVGDRSGGLRAVADVGAEYVVFGSGWLGNEKVWAVAIRNPSNISGGAGAQPPLLVTIDLKTGALEREELSDISGTAPWTISPDRRWLVFGGVVGTCAAPPAGSALLHDRVTGEEFNVVDASGNPASLLPGFLSDGRLVIAQCDQVAHTLDLSVGAPGASPTRIAVVPITTRSPFFTLVSGSDDILVLGSAPDAPQDAYVFDPAGRLLRRIPVPAFARPGTFGFAADLARDGESLGFTVNEPRADPFPNYALRAGVVDLVTGKVTYLCDRDCTWLLVR